LDSTFMFIDAMVAQDPKIMMDYINDIVLPSLRASEESRKEMIPPHLPNTLEARIQRGNQWFRVNHVESQKLPIPEDPIKVHHEEFWSTKLKHMGLSEAVHKIPNRYYDDAKNNEPWFEMKGPGGQVIRFGPRKRVYSIQVTSEIPFRIEKIAEAAKADNVTFTADDRWHGWDAKEAKDMEVHAWAWEKFTAYFACILLDLGGSVDIQSK